MSTAESRFMVMGLTGLVLRDLIETMKESFPCLEASTTDNAANAVALIGLTNQWKFAFLNLSPDAFTNSDLARSFEALGTKIILLGHAAEEAAAASPYPVLIRPFMPDDILNLLGKKQ